MTGDSCGRGSARPSRRCPQRLLAYRNRSHLPAGNPGGQPPVANDYFLSGQPIPDERLEADPLAELAANVASLGLGSV